jgi:type II secretory pathway pseudopilin PulG
MSTTCHAKYNLLTLRSQRGAVFIVMLVIMVMGAATILVSSFSKATLQIERDKKTAEALALAKEALIGYATSVNLPDGGRLGDLPCPDRNNDGEAETSCGDAGGSNQSRRLGRLPWKTLGLPDLRDGSGERLWYAVSNNFKNNTRTTCTSPGQPGCLNSDTKGTISIFAVDGSQQNDGGGSTGAVAVVIAPGSLLQRQDGYQQDRSSIGINTAKNYLDIATVGGNTEDNANFSDGSHSNGFIQGPIKDASGNIITNDQLLTITQDNIMQPIQKRVVAEVKRCLIEYAADPQNNGRYPWTTDPTTTDPVSYDDHSNRLFGRVPDTPFNSTRNNSGYHMNDVWGADCNIQYGSWWINWKEMVFFGIADAYKPKNPPSPATCGTCLTVNPPSANADKQFVVIAAGKKLAGQSRGNSDHGTLSNYLEDGNANGATPFEQRASSASFNDVVVFQ